MKNNTHLSHLMMLLSCLCMPLFACAPKSHIDNTPVSELDLNRYLGRWYELARFDHSFERDQTNCTAFYSIKEDGNIRVLNVGMKNGKQKSSEGKAKTTETVGLLRVSFFGPFYSDYRVLMLSEDYTYALVGSSSDKYLWILSRMTSLPDADIQRILAEASRRGYDISQLIWVDQSMNRK